MSLMRKVTRALYTSLEGITLEKPSSLFFSARGALQCFSTDSVDKHSSSLWSSSNPDEVPETKLPNDLSALAELHPGLKEIMKQYGSPLEMSPTSPEGIKMCIESFAAKHGARQLVDGGVTVTKTALGKAKLVELRNLLTSLGADVQGHKDLLVDRILQLSMSAENAMRLSVALLHHKAGRVPHHKVSQVQRQLSKPVVQTPGLYYSPFSPQEMGNILLEAHGRDIAIIDVRNKCTFTDFMVVASAQSSGAARSLAGAILHALREKCSHVAPGVAPTIEGDVDTAEWLVVDAGSIVTHIFLEEWRDEYNLEGLWSDGANIEWLRSNYSKKTLQSMSI